MSPETLFGNVPLLATSVYVPAVSKMRLVSLATPFVVATLVVLAGSKSPGPLSTATVIVEVSLVTTLPNASSTDTRNVGRSIWPAVPVVATRV